VARSLEATGHLQRAKLMYNENGYDESARLLDPCIAGDRCYWTLQSKMKFTESISASKVTVRELQDGSIAVFFTLADSRRMEENRRTEDNHAIKFYTLKPGSDFTLETLPAEAEKWKQVKVVPGSKTDPLHLLVAPLTSPNQSFIDGMLEDMSFMMPASGSAMKKSPIELWEYDESTWKKIVMRGKVPDIHPWAVNVNNPEVKSSSSVDHRYIE
jgi:hypothetical protein